MSDADGLRRTLDGASRVHVDGSVLALHVAGAPRFLPLTRALFEVLADGTVSGATSSISMYQLLAEAYRRGDAESADVVQRYLTTVPGLSIVDVTPSIAGQAAQVRAQLGGGAERALQLATALAGEADVFLTRRSAFRRVAGMSVESLELLAAG